MAIDAVGLVQATKGNIRAFCTMAERFMECLKTKTRGCIGEDVSHRSVLNFLSNKIHLVRSWITFGTNRTLSKMLC